MASGDVVFERADMSVVSVQASTDSGNMWSVRLASTTESRSAQPRSDVSISEVTVQRPSIPFDPAKAYNVTIKEA